MLIIDKDLRIKRASRSFYLKFKLSEKEVDGQLLYDLSDGEWNIKELRRLLERILPGKAVMEDFKVAHKKGKLHLNARKIQIPGEDEMILLALEFVRD